jgi:5'-deoxynucleotidase YfbR-like HD superfamily hydrolase
MTENAQGLVDIGKLILTFAKVNRVTLHEDGVTPESDTDHTVMLSVSACALAQKLYPDTLDLGLVAQFAIAHDLVEAYAMDTDSFNLKGDAKREKEMREHVAFLRIQQEFKDVYPWLPEIIEKYEQLDTREAQFVKTLDKIMPKVTHVLNKASVFKRRENSREEMNAHCDAQVHVCEERFGPYFTDLYALLREFNEAVLTEVHGEK